MLAMRPEGGRLFVDTVDVRLMAFAKEGVRDDFAFQRDRGFEGRPCDVGYQPVIVKKGPVDREGTRFGGGSKA